MAFDGFFSVDKPAGISSRAVVDAVSRAVGTKRVGHAGTLDPMATGVLVVAVGKATQLVEYVQQMPKTYEAEFELGATSDTDDSTGQVERHAVANPPSEADVRVALSRFVGAIEQRPPAYSAIKLSGQRAYRLARSGVAIELPARVVEVHSVELLDYVFPLVRCRIICGSGTYIRSVARDVGERLKTGGLMTQLCRKAIGRFRQEESVSIAGFQKGDVDAASPADWRKFVRPLGEALSNLPTVTLDEMGEIAFHLGQRVAVPLNTNAANAIAVWNDRGQLLGIGRVETAGGPLRPVKGGFARKERDKL